MKKKFCNFCIEKCYNKECDLIPKISKGLYECSTAHDSYLDIKSVLYFEDKDYCRIKLRIIPRIKGMVFYGEGYKWYKIPLENTTKWKRIREI